MESNIKIRRIVCDDQVELCYDLMLSNGMKENDQVLITSKSELNHFFKSKGLEFDINSKIDWNDKMIELKMSDIFHSYLYRKLNLTFVDRSEKLSEFVVELKKEIAVLINKQEAHDLIKEMKPMQRAMGKRDDRSDSGEIRETAS